MFLYFPLQTAMDNHAAIVNFLKGFPEFKKNTFYVTGESYGGIYVPTLSSRIVDDPSINFKVYYQIYQRDICILVHRCIHCMLLYCFEKNATFYQSNAFDCIFRGGHIIQFCDCV